MWVCWERSAAGAAERPCESRPNGLLAAADSMSRGRAGWTGGCGEGGPGGRCFLSWRSYFQCARLLRTPASGYYHAASGLASWSFCRAVVGCCGVRFLRGLTPYLAHASLILASRDSSCHPCGCTRAAKGRSGGRRAGSQNRGTSWCVLGGSVCFPLDPAISMTFQEGPWSPFLMHAGC